MEKTDKVRLDELLENCRKNLPNVREDLIKKAFDFALIAHEHDRRASNEPYIVHPFSVANILATEIPFDDICIVCALLHDIVEDNEDYTIDTIRRNFGEEIAVIVDGLTKIKNLFRGADVTLGENYRKLLMSIIKDVRVLIVKLADRLNNMRTLEFLISDKRKSIATETLEIYAPLANRFGLGQIKWELEDLSFKELNRQAYEDIKKKINAKRDERESYIKKFSDPIVKILDKEKFHYEINGRAKHLYSIYKKMIKRNKPFEEIYDLFAIRIIIDEEEKVHCYTTFGLVNEIYTPIPDRFKDYIAIPKANNYQSIHSTVFGPNGTAVEVQIRTKWMHEIAEKGVAAHWKYKEDTRNTDKKIENYVKWIRELLDSSGDDELRKNIIENFKLNLYTDEIFVFTPNGDLKRLPINSTPVDFAFAVHSKVGHHCIGAKVNHKIVPLDTSLQSGDQVDIITSKNQHPNRNWLKFVKTGKAKSEIRKWLNKEEEAIVEAGKEALEKKLKKSKIAFTSQDMQKLSTNLHFDNIRLFYIALGKGDLNIDNIFTNKENEDTKAQQLTLAPERFSRYARSTAGKIVVNGESADMLMSFSKCCNPIPGDSVAGYVSTVDGIKIHRKNCRNLIDISLREPEKIVDIQWPQLDGSAFIVALSVKGEDSAGLLQEISHSIVSYKNTNIKSINIDTNDSLFEGIVTLYVENIEHLARIIDRLKKIKGVYSVARLDLA